MKLTKRTELPLEAQLLVLEEFARIQGMPKYGQRPRSYVVNGVNYSVSRNWQQFEASGAELHGLPMPEGLTDGCVVLTIEHNYMAHVQGMEQRRLNDSDQANLLSKLAVLRKSRDSVLDEAMRENIIAQIKAAEDRIESFKQLEVPDIVTETLPFVVLPQWQ